MGMGMADLIKFLYCSTFYSNLLNYLKMKENFLIDVLCSIMETWKRKKFFLQQFIQ